MHSPIAPLRLFKVTLAWNLAAAEEGDYVTKLWAESSDAAVQAVAKEMADHRPGGNDRNISTGDAEFIQSIIQSAGTYAVIDVYQDLTDTLADLLAGSSCKMTASAKVDLAHIGSILTRYCRG